MRHSHAFFKGPFSMLALLFPTAGPSQMPSQEGSMGDTSKPPTAPLALRSAGPLGLAAGAAPQQAGALRNRMQLWRADGSPYPLHPHLPRRSLLPLQGMGMGQQARDEACVDSPFASAGPWLQEVALASLLLLASAGLLTGLLWCCCPARWLAWCPGAYGFYLSYPACHTCPGQVAPGGLQPSRPAFQGQGGCRREAETSEEGEWTLGSHRLWVLSPSPSRLSDPGQVTQPSETQSASLGNGMISFLALQGNGEGQRGKWPCSSCGGWDSAGSAKARTSMPRVGSRGPAHPKLP